MEPVRFYAERRMNLHVSKILQRFVQHDDVGVFLLEASRFVFSLIITPFAKVLLHYIRLLALPLLLALDIKLLRLTIRVDFPQAMF